MTVYVLTARRGSSAWGKVLGVYTTSTAAKDIAGLLAWEFGPSTVYHVDAVIVDDAPEIESEGMCRPVAPRYRGDRRPGGGA